MPSGRGLRQNRQRASSSLTCVLPGTQSATTLLGVICVVLLIILPISFGNVEYYQFGFRKNRNTGTVRHTLDLPRGRARRGLGKGQFIEGKTGSQ